MHRMLSAFGFSPTWVIWVMSMVSSTFFSILVNGVPSSTFHPSSGIRQGHPLSPLLFVLMAEGLGRLIRNALLTQQLRGISIHDSPPITHQQFVDDNMLFGHPSVQEVFQFKSLLDGYLEASEASTNTTKSQIFFFHTPYPLNSLYLASLDSLKPLFPQSI